MNNKTNLKVINRDMLKYIAAIAMFIGHFLLYTAKEIRYFNLPTSLVRVFIYLQFIAPPIFFFFIAEGFKYTRSKKNYALRLMVITIITQFPFVLYNCMKFDIHLFFTRWNVMLSLFLGLVTLIISECKLPVPVRLLLIASCMYISYLLKAEWYIFGLLIILAFHLLRERPYLRLAVYEIIALIYCSTGGNGISIPHFIWLSLPIIIITFFYNGQKGRFPKFSNCFFYVFYPAHLLLIFFVKLIAG
ncbi:MAG: hypothetical protein J6A58_01025 [Oscillospiraceae bacterium]|nr:hypothetical protein [Oscillospiraceae bacterium]